jgi:hypothetical protein
MKSRVTLKYGHTIVSSQPLKRIRTIGLLDQTVLTATLGLGVAGMPPVKKTITKEKKEENPMTQFKQNFKLSMYEQSIKDSASKVADIAKEIPCMSKLQATLNDYVNSVDKNAKDAVMERLMSLEPVKLDMFLKSLAECKCSNFEQGIKQVGAQLFGDDMTLVSIIGESFTSAKTSAQMLIAYSFVKAGITQKELDKMVEKIRFARANASSASSSSNAVATQPPVESDANTLAESLGRMSM